jgi:hypothetical protein
VIVSSSFYLIAVSLQKNNRPTHAAWQNTARSRLKTLPLA